MSHCSISWFCSRQLITIPDTVRTPYLTFNHVTITETKSRQKNEICMETKELNCVFFVLEYLVPTIIWHKTCGFIHVTNLCVHTSSTCGMFIIYFSLFLSSTTAIHTVTSYLWSIIDFYVPSIIRIISTRFKTDNLNTYTIVFTCYTQDEKGLIRLQIRLFSLITHKTERGLMIWLKSRLNLKFQQTISDKTMFLVKISRIFS